jgi:hypothetical protein
VPTSVGPLSRISAGQVVVVQKLPGVAGEGVHELTATLELLLFEQLTEVQELPKLGPALVQDGTGTLFCTTGAGQLVSTQLSPKFGPETVQLATGMLVDTRVGQIVAVYMLVPSAGTAVHEPTGVSGELLVPQVVVV